MSALTSRWVRNLPKAAEWSEIPRARAKEAGNSQKMLVIDHDPDEFKRSYR